MKITNEIYTLKFIESTNEMSEIEEWKTIKI